MSDPKDADLQYHIERLVAIETAARNYLQCVTLDTGDREGDFLELKKATIVLKLMLGHDPSEIYRDIDMAAFRLRNQDQWRRTMKRIGEMIPEQVDHQERMEKVESCR